jgi:hypothetical protein
LRLTHGVDVGLLLRLPVAIGFVDHLGARALAPQRIRERPLRPYNRGCSHHQYGTSPNTNTHRSRFSFDLRNQSVVARRYRRQMPSQKRIAVPMRQRARDYRHDPPIHYRAVVRDGLRAANVRKRNPRWGFDRMHRSTVHPFARPKTIRSTRRNRPLTVFHGLVTPVVMTTVLRNRCLFATLLAALD